MTQRLIVTFVTVVAALVLQPLPRPSQAGRMSGLAAPIAAPCPGDCGADGDVTVDEILTLVNIALGLAAVTQCPAGDTDGNQQITIDEILAAVGAALNGCPPSPTATPSPTPTLSATAVPTATPIPVHRTWTQLRPSTSPPARYGHAMTTAFGPFVFGGQSAPRSLLGDTWEWDGSRWIEYHPTTAPPALTGHAMVYDEARQQVVLFGGTTSIAHDGAPSGLSNSTWVWDGNVWRLRAAVEVWPSARWLHAMAYDPRRARVVLFGGQVSQAVWLADTWEWDGASWTQIVTPPGATLPPHRYAHAMAYDFDNPSSVAVFGGVSATNLAGTNEMLLWDGTDWSDILTILPQLTLPPARKLHALASNPDSRSIILFGGTHAAGALADTWVWTGIEWLHTQPPVSPPARSGHAMTFQPATSEVLLFGGVSANGTAMDDTWVYGVGPQ